MNSTMWTYFFMMVGILGIVLINIFTDMLIANERDYFALKEIAEAAMFDSIDQKAYMRGLGYDGINRDNHPELIVGCESDTPGTFRIRQEKFVESFILRLARELGTKKTYEVVFNEITECPPKASITIKAKDKFSFIELFRVEYDSDEVVVNRLTGILEQVPYKEDEE